MVPVSATGMLSAFFFFLCSVLCCSARDTITPGELLHHSGETLVSAGKTFELGFFNPSNGSSKNIGRFVGIWYYMSKPRRVVWVANRDKPLPVSDNQSGVFAIKEDGKLKVVGEDGSVYWHSEIKNPASSSSSAAGRVVKLMESGNLVLRDNRTREILWESFRNPTDTFLPGMKMDANLTLTSWLSSVNPAPGNYTFKMDQDNDDQYIIWQNSIIQYWSSKEAEGTPDELTDAVIRLLSNDTEASELSMSNNLPNEKFRGLVLNYSGEIQYYLNLNLWSPPNWKAPQDRCSVSKACGKFGSCNVNNYLKCKCLPGFEPVSPVRWKNGEYSGGCTRKSPICEKNSSEDGFLSLKMMQVRKPDSTMSADPNDIDCCKNACLRTCQCQAFSDKYVDNYESGRVVNATLECLIWTDDLTGLQEYTPEAYNLFVRVAPSDIKPTSSTCETCGSYMIPYPLSTGPKCGDPEYYNFECDNRTGQLRFKAPAGRDYNVTSINPETSTFEIQLKGENCSSREKIPPLNPPFSLTGVCNEVGINNSHSMLSSVKISTVVVVVVEISWALPREPPCTSPADCKDWHNSTCRKKHGIRRCFCNENFSWNSSSLNCIQRGGNPAEFAARVNMKSSSSSPVVAISITIAVALVVVLGIIIAYLRKRTIIKRKEKIANQERHLYQRESRLKHLIDSEQFEEEDKKGIDVPFFDFEDILAATDDFSDANKLGQGGFGPVYKGNFPEGQEIAVKRLSRASGQGLHEFKNEVVLIAKLQHRNLVRLLGYCVEGDEKILLYEYLPNKSLDSFVFDQTQCKLLNWEKRFDIILGIARGLLYLHQDSRLKIIHRDLKTSNILLDDEMNPKISDFGLARILKSRQVEAITERVAGTYGYMAPEYALDGFFSEKSDVFSFGVMVLEIISGKRNTGFYQSDQVLSLLGLAWKLWKEGKVLELMDQTLSETCNTDEFLRCVNVGLLCVQEDPSDRPTMAVALVMLSSDNASTPVPKPPAFVIRRDISSTASSSSKHEVSWNNEMLASVEEGR